MKREEQVFFLMCLFIDRPACCSCFLLSAAPSQAPGKIMWNTSNSKVILRWDQVHALENESEVTGYKVGRGPAYCSRSFLSLSLVEESEGPAGVFVSRKNVLLQHYLSSYTI